MTYKGKELDGIIELELIKMLDEGYEDAKITQANLYRRLKEKGVISTRSTLSSRRELIDKFAKAQQDKLGGLLGETIKNTRSMNRKELENANTRLAQQIKESRSMLRQNTICIMDILKEVRRQTRVQNVERCLTPNLIKELHDSENILKDET